VTGGFTPPPLARLPASTPHIFGFGGLFLTKSRRYSVTFTYLRDHRTACRRTVHTGPNLPA